MDLEEIRRNSLGSVKGFLDEIGQNGINEEMEEELYQKIDGTEQLINYQTDLTSLKEDICDTFQKLKDDINTMLTAFEIEIMSKISSIEQGLTKNVLLSEVKKELASLKTKKASQFTKRDTSFIKDLSELNELEFIQKNLKQIVTRVSSIRDNTTQNVEDITQKIRVKTQNILSQFDLSYICKKDESIFEDLSNFEGKIAGEILCEGEVNCICNISENYFMITQNQNKIALYNSQDFLCKQKIQFTGGTRTIAQLNTDTVAVGTDEGNIYIFKFDKNNEILLLKKKISLTMMMWELCKINSSCIAAVSFCGKLKIVNFKTGKIVKQFINESQCFVSVKSISPQYMCVSSNIIQIFDKTTLEIVSEYQNYDMGYIFSIEVLDSQRIAFGGTDSKVRVWNHLTKTLEATLVNHKSQVYQIKKISQHHLSSCSEDGKLLIWDISNNYQCIFAASSHTQSTFSIEVLPKQKLLITGGKENILKVWE